MAGRLDIPAVVDVGTESQRLSLSSHTHTLSSHLYISLSTCSRSAEVPEVGKPLIDHKDISAGDPLL
ncbi:hypothetical protein I3843_09G160100 [Carya illinoinensis]|nr:hypothetical protein I3843_09G160100 [Carya illinoinensis]